MMAEWWTAAMPPPLKPEILDLELALAV